jgi:FlaG/FlaF family flagellin (archaellin)
MKLTKKFGRRFRRGLRAVSPVIAVLLMIVIAVAASLFAYAWVMGYLDFLSGKTNQGIQISAINFDGVDTLTAYAQNVGPADATISNVYLNDVLVVYSIDVNPLGPGATATITVTPYGGASPVTVKVVTADGNIFMLTKSFAGGSGGGGVIPTVQYRKPITITGVTGGPHTNFPVLVSISGDTDIGGSTGGSGGSVDGDHIYFTDSDGTTKLDHEIESFTGGAAVSLVAWVKVLSLTNNKVIYIYYGSDVAGGQENPTGVWDSSYRAVYHLSEDPSGTAPQIKDSTANNNDATSYGSMTTGDQVSAKIGGGLDFDGSGDYLEAPHTSSLDITGDTITLSAWVNPQSQSGAHIILCKPHVVGAHTDPYFSYSIHLLSSGNTPRLWITTSGGYQFEAATSTISYGSWSYIRQRRSGRRNPNQPNRKHKQLLHTTPNRSKRLAWRILQIPTG